MTKEVGDIIFEIEENMNSPMITLKVLWIRFL